MVAKRVGRPRKTAIEITTEGQRLLVERPEGVTELARLVGVAEQRIDDWRSGRRKPTAASARQLASTLGIPLEAWSRVPGATPPAPVAPPLPPRPPTALEEIEEMLSTLRSTEGLTEKEAAKRLSERSRLLALKARIEYQERLAEDAIVRSHPRWKEIREAIRRALAPHAEALAAVHAELAAVGAWEDAKSELERASSEEVSA